MSVSLTIAGTSAADGRFSYADLTPEAAQIARTAAAAIRNTQAGFVRDVGEHLLRAKAKLPHGRFLAWADAELGINRRTASNYMQAASWLEGKSATVSHLPPTVLYALSAPSAPAQVVRAVVAAAAAGEALDARRIENQLCAAKLHEAELKATQRRNPGLTGAELNARKAKAARAHARQLEAEQAAQARQEQEMQDTLRPLADDILANPGDLAARLVKALVNYSETRALVALLQSALREVVQ